VDTLGDQVPSKLFLSLVLTIGCWLTLGFGLAEARWNDFAFFSLLAASGGG
jgi:hypothetical protein